MDLVKAKTYANNASKAPGREFVQADDVWHYVNHSPHFTVHYYPRRDPEELWYREWENEFVAYGWRLRVHYENLKANAPYILTAATVPYDPASEQPYIRHIEYRLRP